MTFLTDRRFLKEYVLLKWPNGIKKKQVDKIDLHTINKVNDEIILIDPDLSTLLILKELNKKVVLVFTRIENEFREILQYSFIKKIIIFDSLDELYLKSIHCNKYILAKPLISEVGNLAIHEKSDKLIILDDFEKIDINKLLYLLDENTNYSFELSGMKKIRNQEEFFNFRELIYQDNLILKSYPLFDLKNYIAKHKVLINFSKNFPFNAYYAILTGNLVLNASDRYFSFILSETHVMPDINKLFREFNILKKKQKDLFEEYFYKIKTFEEALKSDV